VKTRVAAAIAVLAVSVAGLAWIVATREEPVRAVDVPGVPGSTLDAAAQVAHGRRVLAIVARRGAAPEGTILQSAEGPEGWKPYSATRDPADPLLPALASLAAAAAADFAPDQAFERQTVLALADFDVAVVVASDGERAMAVNPGERNPDLGLAPEVPALRVTKASPVWHFLAEELSIDSADAVGFARQLRRGDAIFQDDVFKGWGGAMTIEAPVEAEYLLPFSASGARVTLDGAPADAHAARVPVLVVRVPAGRHRVEVAYGPSSLLRDAVAIAAASGVVVALIVLWLALRAHPEKDAVA
jgi:hypothetical protein